MRREAGGRIRGRSGVARFVFLTGGPGVGWTLFAAAVAVFLFVLVLALDDGAHPVVALGVDLDAVDLALEAGEALAELLDGEDELDDGAFGAAEALAGHAHGDAGRVGNEHDGGDAAGHVGEADFFGLVAEEFLIGLRGREDGIEVFVAGVVDEAGEIQLDHGRVHLVGEFFEGDVAVAVGIFGDEFGERLFEGGFGVVEAFELEEIFEQRAPLALGGADGEEDEDGVVAGAGDLDAAAVEELGDDGCGDAPVADTALGVDAGGEDGDLGGVEHAVAVGDVFVLDSRATLRRA